VPRMSVHAQAYASRVGYGTVSPDGAEGATPR
jgi:hypothetical protein